MLQGLDTYIYPWVVFTPPAGAGTPGAEDLEPLARHTDDDADMEMVDVNLQDPREPATSVDGLVADEAKAMV